MSTLHLQLSITVFHEITELSQCFETANGSVKNKIKVLYMRAIHVLVEDDQEDF